MDVEIASSASSESIPIIAEYHLPSFGDLSELNPYTKCQCQICKAMPSTMHITAPENNC
jgi:hypothetical protein